MAIQTVHHTDDPWPSGEWKRQRHGLVDASVFGKICRWKVSFAPSFLYCKPYDYEFWGRIYPKLRVFYFGFMLPELASPRHLTDAQLIVI